MIVVDCTKSEPIEQTVLLNIVTGAGFGCGTTANVFCILTGKCVRKDLLCRKRFYFNRYLVALNLQVDMPVKYFLRLLYTTQRPLFR